MPTIRDIFGAEDSNAVGKIKEVSKWIEELPISSLPFVDIGFDTLETSMIDSLNDQRAVAEGEEYARAEIQVRN